VSARDALRTLARGLPAGTPVPVPAELLLELLDSEPHAPANLVSSDLTVAQVAARYGRAPSTVRGWCDVNRFAGAYRLNGREWRIPPSALESFDAAQRRGHRPAQPGVTGQRRQGSRRGKGRLALGAWRGEGAA